MRCALFPGTFDPPTNGHLDIIERAAQLFESVVVAVLTDVNKRSCLFSPEERVLLIKKIIRHLSNVQVIGYKGLAVDIAKRYEAGAIIRGIRSSADLNREMELAGANKLLSGIETLFLPVSAPLNFVSASIVKEIGNFGGDLAQFIPLAIVEEVSGKLRL